MSLSRRKLTLQLTPLLDLLLIVIFAQYMAMRQETVKAESQAEQRMRAAQQELDEAARRVAESQSQAERRQREAERREALLAERARQAEEQRATVGKLAAALFDVPPALAEQSLSQALGTEEAAGRPRSPEEIAQLRRELQRLASLGADDLVRHLLTYHELRKRADVWTVSIAENGVVTFQADERSFEFRARSSEEFAQELFGRYKTLAQPKGLVIVLLSYADITEGQARNAVLGLQRATEQMNDDARGRTRFEFAVLGLRPRGPTEMP